MTTYIGNPDYVHGTPARLGLLLVNLGTPDEPTTPAVRRYLAEFLWDPRVIEMPRALWWLILHGIILRVRPAKSAHAYQKVWTPAGSPLLVESRARMQALASRLQDRFGDRVRVDLAMTYGMANHQGLMAGASATRTEGTMGLVSAIGSAAGTTLDWR